MLVTGSGARDAFAAGRAIGGPEELRNAGRTLPGVARVALDADDVLEVVATGGGGFGDPIEREPERVALDVRSRLVSRTEAVRVYGVVLATDGSVDEVATAGRREAIRAERLGASGTPITPAAPTAMAPDGWTRLTVDGRRAARCNRCGTTREGAGSGEPIESMPALALPLRAAGPHVGDGRADPGFELRLRHCPACGRSLDVSRTRTPEA
jgi:N-methylhydantoinase B